jgi:hypothetical protein
MKREKWTIANNPILINLWFLFLWYNPFKIVKDTIICFGLETFKKIALGGNAEEDVLCYSDDLYFSQVVLSVNILIIRVFYSDPQVCSYADLDTNPKPISVWSFQEKKNDNMVSW